MHFSRIDKHDASDRRYVLTSTIGKLLRALFNDSYHIALMRMRSKAVRDICRMQQFKITERGVMPEFDMLMLHTFLLLGKVQMNVTCLINRKVQPCHAERSEASVSLGTEMLRFADPSLHSG